MQSCEDHIREKYSRKRKQQGKITKNGSVLGMSNEELGSTVVELGGQLTPLDVALTGVNDFQKLDHTELYVLSFVIGIATP